jgi:hypothetical protein
LLSKTVVLAIWIVVCLSVFSFEREVEIRSLRPLLLNKGVTQAYIKQAESTMPYTYKTDNEGDHAIKTLCRRLKTMPLQPDPGLLELP